MFVLNGTCSVVKMNSTLKIGLVVKLSSLFRNLLISPNIHAQQY